MPNSCAAFGCTNRYYKGTSLQYFSFPLNNPKKLAQWVHAIRRENWTPTKYSRICSSHFRASDYLHRPGINVPRLKENAVPSVFEAFPRRFKKRAIERKSPKMRHNPEIISDSETNLSSIAVGRKRKLPSSRSAVPMKTRYSLRRAAAEEAFHQENEEREEILSEPEPEILSEPDEGEGSLHLEAEEVKCEEVSLSVPEPVIETPPFTYQNLCDHYWSVVTLPSSLWAIHKGLSDKFIAFTHISEDTSSLFLSTDKTVLFDGTLEAEMFIRGQKVTPPDIFKNALESVQDLDGLLKEMETLDLCKGTGLIATRYSSDCNLFLEKKHRNSRCSGCSVKRTHLKKTEAQRLRRAAAREESMKNKIAGKKQNKVGIECSKGESEVTSLGSFLNEQESQFLDGDEDDELGSEGHDTE